MKDTVESPKLNKDALGVNVTVEKMNYGIEQEHLNNAFWRAGFTKGFLVSDTDSHVIQAIEK